MAFGIFPIFAFLAPLRGSLLAGDVHLAVFCDYPLGVAIPILRVLAWKNVMAFVYGANSKKSHNSPERNPFGPHSDS